MSCPRHKPAAGYLRTISTCTPPCTSRRTRTSTCRLLTWTKCLAIRYPFRAALAGIQTGCQRRDLPLLVGPACTPCRAEGRRFPKGPRQTPSQGSKHTSLWSSQTSDLRLAGSPTCPCPRGSPQGRSPQGRASHTLPQGHTGLKSRCNPESRLRPSRYHKFGGKRTYRYITRHLSNGRISSCEMTLAWAYPSNPGHTRTSGALGQATTGGVGDCRPFRPSMRIIVMICPIMSGSVPVSHRYGLTWTFAIRSSNARVGWPCDGTFKRRMAVRFMPVHACLTGGLLSRPRPPPLLSPPEIFFYMTLRRGKGSYRYTESDHYPGVTELLSVRIAILASRRSLYI